MSLATIIKTAIVAALAIRGTALPSSSLSIQVPTDLSKPELGLMWLTEANVEEYLAANNVTIETGTVDGSSDLSKRDDIPDGCAFERSGITYAYQSFNTAGHGQACFGLVPFPNCGADDSWHDPDWTDLQKVVQQQIAKDGLLELSFVGDWSAGFIPFTTAYHNRDWTWFAIGLLVNKIRAMQYYYSRDFDYMSISKRHGC